MLKTLPPSLAWLALSIGLALPQPVLAATIEVVSQTVSYADLDLTRPADMARLERRVQATVERVCGYDHRQKLSERVQRSICVGATGPEARRKVRAVVDAAFLQAAEIRRYREELSQVGE